MRAGFARSIVLAAVVATAHGTAQADDPRWIRTVRGVGYRFDTAGDGKDE